MNPWRKLILFASIVVLPAIAVGVSNLRVFPDSAFVATVMLLITVVVAGVFTWQSKDAIAKIARYCVLADVIICVILCFNLGGHWLLSREVSAARQAVADRRVEEDRDEKRREAEARRQIEIERAKTESLKEQTRAINAERRRLSQLPPERRRSVLAAASSRTAPESRDEHAAPQSAEASITPAPVTQLTPEQVTEKWWWYLTALAFAECFASILAGAVLQSIWEWDRNHAGVPDHPQNGVAWPREIEMGK